MTFNEEFQRLSPEDQMLKLEEIEAKLKEDHPLKGTLPIHGHAQIEIQVILTGDNRIEVRLHGLPSQTFEATNVSGWASALNGGVAHLLGKIKDLNLGPVSADTLSLYERAEKAQREIDERGF